MKSKVELSPAAQEARKAYYREYYAKNRDRIQQKRAARWERKASQQAAADDAR